MIPCGNFFILHLMTPNNPRAEFYSSSPSIWYVIWYPSGNFLILHSMTPEHPRAKLYSLRPPFDMSHDTLLVTFSFCTWWPQTTPGLNSNSLRLSIWYVIWYPSGNFLILHSMTQEHPRAKLYLSRPSIWYIIWYPSGNFLILHSMTMEYPQAELYSLSPLIWYVTRYP
jgi:hypothetical protein